MRLNFTGRRKIDKQHARVVFRDDPVGTNSGHYFELTLELDSYNLPAEGRVFVEATRGLSFMRFDMGSVRERAVLSPTERRLSAFTPTPDGVKLRVKITQASGPDAGKLLAEADGITPEVGGALPLINLAGGDLGPTPWRLELIPTDSDLPTLYIHSDLGGKEYAKDPVAKPLLMTAAAREVFAALVHEGDHEDEPEHWASLWTRFGSEVLGLPEMPDADESDEIEIREWIEGAVNAFAAKHELANALVMYKATLELEELEEVI